MELVKSEIIDNIQIAKSTFSMTLLGNWTSISSPGQFINIKLPGKYLRRPISVCRVSGDVLTIVYKVVGDGTEMMSNMPEGTQLEVLSGLGNGFDIGACSSAPLLVGGGAGVAPLFGLGEALIASGKKPLAVLGFNSEDEIFLAKELSQLGIHTAISTVDGSLGVKGFVTDAMKMMAGKYDYVFACGPEPMLKAVHNFDETDGQYSFEARMACGFGACVGCTCQTKYGAKRICKDGPVLQKGEIIW